MGSPGVFIHAGTLGGKLSAFSPAASASPAAKPPAMTAPPTKALPPCRNRLRVVVSIPSSMSTGSAIRMSPSKNPCLSQPNQRNDVRQDGSQGAASCKHLRDQGQSITSLRVPWEHACALVIHSD